MKTQIRIEPQRLLASHDQQQLVEGRDLGRQLGAIAEQPAAIDNPADAFGAQRMSRVFGFNHLAGTGNPGGADRTKPPFGLLELLHEASVPSIRQADILVNASDEFALGPLEAQVQAIRRTRAVLHHSNIVVKARIETRRSDQIALKQLAVGRASHER
jgi:hypothetical protein